MIILKLVIIITELRNYVGVGQQCNGNGTAVRDAHTLTERKQVAQFMSVYLCIRIRRSER